MISFLFFTIELIWLLLLYTCNMTVRMRDGTKSRRHSIKGQQKGPNQTQRITKRMDQELFLHYTTGTRQLWTTVKQCAPTAVHVYNVCRLPVLKCGKTAHKLKASPLVIVSSQFSDHCIRLLKRKKKKRKKCSSHQAVGCHSTPCSVSIHQWGAADDYSSICVRQWHWAMKARAFISELRPWWNMEARTSYRQVSASEAGWSGHGLENM